MSRARWPAAGLVLALLAGGWLFGQAPPPAAAAVRAAEAGGHCLLRERGLPVRAGPAAGRGPR